MRTRGTPKLESPPLGRQVCSGFILRALRPAEGKMRKTNPIPPGEIPQHSAILSFHQSTADCAKRTQSRQPGWGPRDVGRGANVRNEPNFRIADFCPRSEPGGDNIADWGRPAPGYTCPAPYHLRSARAVCTNKPNSRSQSCKTKPTSGAAWRDGAGGTRDEGTNAQNEPNLPPDRQVGPRLRPIMQNEPSFRRNAKPTKRRLCTTKQNMGGLEYLGDGAWGEPLVRNKANSAEAAGRASTL
jgi:hypothetical protein